MCYHMDEKTWRRLVAEHTAKKAREIVTAARDAAEATYDKKHDYAAGERVYRQAVKAAERRLQQEAERRLQRAAERLQREQARFVAEATQLVGRALDSPLEREVETV